MISAGRRAAFIHERHRLWSGHITGFDVVNSKTRPFDHRANWSVEMAAAADVPPRGRQPILPSTHGLVGRQAMLSEQELTPGPQHAPHLCKRRARPRDRAQGPGGDDAIDTMLVERN